MNYKNIIEGLLFLSGENGLTIGEIISILNINEELILNHIEELKEEYNKNHGLTIIYTAQTYKITTKNEYSEYFKKYANEEFSDKLSPSALETLAIIAYNQPISRFDIEEKRGVLTTHNIRTLVNRNLVKVVGKSEEIGKPNLYGTTNELLNYLGINSLEELPPLAEFELNIENEEQGDLFNNTEDFKEIKKRLLSNDNIIVTKEYNELDEIDSIEISDIKLQENEDENIYE